MECLGYDAKLHLVMRRHFWSPEECRVPLLCHYWILNCICHTHWSCLEKACLKNIFSSQSLGLWKQASLTQYSLKNVKHIEFQFDLTITNKSKLATVVEDVLKAPFSIATTRRCRGGRYSFSRIDPLYPWFVPYYAECWARRHQVPFFESLVWLNLGLNPGLPGHWWTL